MKYSLINPQDIMACGIDINNGSKATITLLDIFGGVENKDNSLNHVSYMVSYIWTTIHYYRLQTGRKEYDTLFDIIQKYLVELGYTISYEMPIFYTETIKKATKKYLTINEVYKILETKETFNQYLNMVWVRY